MTRTDLAQAARREMPDIEIEVLPDAYRHNVIDGLEGQDNLGIELGVAAGTFSARMVRSGKFAHFYGVDVYGDSHDTGEYKDALRAVGLGQPYSLLRMTFEEAIDLFPDNHFDFIYVDGFAHTGEEGGRTLIDWFAKLKVGGILAGDDYHDDWPLVKWGVHALASQLGTGIRVTGRTEDEKYCSYPSWFLTRPETAPVLTAPRELVALGQAERTRVERRRNSLAARVLRPVKRRLLGR